AELPAGTAKTRDEEPRHAARDGLCGAQSRIRRYLAFTHPRPAAIAIKNAGGSRDRAEKAGEEYQCRYRFGPTSRTGAVLVHFSRSQSRQYAAARVGSTGSRHFLEGLRSSEVS